MKIPTEGIRVAIRCGLHEVELEHQRDECMHPLDLAQFSCPGYAIQVQPIREYQRQIDKLARTHASKLYRENHPEEVALYPADWRGHVSFDDYEDVYQQQLLDLDRQDEEIAEQCISTWYVTMTQKGAHV